MLIAIGAFFLHWGITSLSLWVASRLFVGIRFASVSDLVVAALMLSMVNSVLRPVLILLTLPLTLLSFGLFLLVINALMLMLVSALVRGFHVSGFGTAFFASIFISLLSLFVQGFVLSDGSSHDIIRLPNPGGIWT
jgi:putative membrane protein